MPAWAVLWSASQNEVGRRQNEDISFITQQSGQALCREEADILHWTTTVVNRKQGKERTIQDKNLSALLSRDISYFTQFRPGMKNTKEDIPKCFYNNWAILAHRKHCILFSAQNKPVLNVLTWICSLRCNTCQSSWHLFACWGQKVSVPDLANQGERWKRQCAAINY